MNLTRLSPAYNLYDEQYWPVVQHRGDIFDMQLKQFDYMVQGIRKDKIMGQFHFCPTVISGMSSDGKLRFNRQYGTPAFNLEVGSRVMNNPKPRLVVYTCVPPKTGMARMALKAPGKSAGT